MKPDALEQMDDPWLEKAVGAALALRRRDPVRDHVDALEVSDKGTRWFRKDREPEVFNVTAENVIAALNRAGIRPVLMGTYGIGGYRSEARATDDVDVLVTKREVRKAVRVLDAEFPYLEILENAVVVRFRNPATQKIVLDVIKPTTQAIRVVFRNTVEIGETHRIPNLEMALASKFVAMIAPTRRLDKKQIDAGDFTNIVLYNRDTIDLEKLKRLGDKVHPHGGAMMFRMIEDIDAGRVIQL
jgi:hypothetical protein